MTENLASDAALLIETAKSVCEVSGVGGSLEVVISMAGLKATSFPAATARKSEAVTESISVTAAILPLGSTMTVVGRDVTPYL